MDDFPPGSEFFDVDNALVVRLPDGSCVRANGSPYPFPGAVAGFGYRLTEAEFKALVSEESR